MIYLLDTNACIDTIRGLQPVLDRIGRISPTEIAVSTIVWYELFTGAQKCKDPQRELTKLERFRYTVHEVVFDFPAAQRAARARADLESRGEMIGPYDVLIAGHALELELTLVTANTSEFARIPGLKIENWRLPAP